MDDWVKTSNFEGVISRWGSLNPPSHSLMPGRTSEFKSQATILGV